MNKVILIIDDDKAVRKAFRLTLEDMGFKLEEAENGETGIRKFKENDDVGLIFLDLNMPGMSGLEVLLKIRYLNPSVPIYVVTAFYKEFFAGLQKTAQNGISFDLLNKPISSDELADIAKSIMGNCELE